MPRFTAHPGQQSYYFGRGKLSDVLQQWVPQLPEGLILPDRETAQQYVDYLNEHLEEQEPHDVVAGTMVVIEYVPDKRVPRHRRAQMMAPFLLAKNCLTRPDYAERVLPLVLGHNKKPDTLIFMMQMAQRYPALKALAIAHESDRQAHSTR